MRFLHPISVLSFGSRALPPDLAFEARDTLMLYQVLEETPGILTAKERERLRPLNFFSSSQPLRQEDVLGYESELKCVVGTLMSTTEVGTEEDSSLSTVTRQLTDPRIAKVGNSQLNTLPDREGFLRNLLELLSDLHVQGDLVSNSPRINTHLPHHFRMAFHSPHSFLASTAPPVRRLLIVLSESWRKGKNNGERRLLNGRRKCKHTIPGRPEQNNGRNRENAWRSNGQAKGATHKISQLMHHGRHRSTLQNLLRILVSLGTTSMFRRETWMTKSLALPGGVEWTNALSRP